MLRSQLCGNPGAFSLVRTDLLSDTPVSLPNSSLLLPKNPTKPLHSNPRLPDACSAGSSLRPVSSLRSLLHSTARSQASSLCPPYNSAWKSSIFKDEFFFKFILERACTSWGRGRGCRESQAESTVGVEPNVGLDPMTLTS